MLTFDEASHTYRWNGAVKPSVTQVLSRLHDFSMVPRDVLEAACERGTIVHKLCEYHDQRDLDPESIGQWHPYLDAWLAFSEDYGAQWEGIEEQHYSERFGYAGTTDRRGRLTKLKPGQWIVDIKTGAKLHRVCGMQLAAYRQQAAERVHPSWLLARRTTVQLRPDGKYTFLEWSDPDDWPAFQSLINLHNWSVKQ